MSQKEKSLDLLMKATAQLEVSEVRRFLTPRKQEKAEGVKHAALAPCTLVSRGRGVSRTPPVG